MQKTYILDTNILLHNPQAIHSFEDNEVVIPLAVIEEIDHQKRRQDEIGKNAREVSRSLDALRGKGSLANGVILPDGGTIRIEVNHWSTSELPAGIDWSRQDNRILAVAYQLQRERHNIHLVTKDLNLRIKADVIGIPSEDFYRDKVQVNSLYDGVGTEVVTEEQFALFHRAKKLVIQNGWEGYLHHLCAERALILIITAGGIFARHPLLLVGRGSERHIAIFPRQLVPGFRTVPGGINVCNVGFHLPGDANGAIIADIHTRRYGKANVRSCTGGNQHRLCIDVKNLAARYPQG